MAAGPQKEIEALARELESGMDARVMAQLRAPFGCEFIQPLPAIGLFERSRGYWRIHDANDDVIASVSPREEGYARLIVRALNAHFARGDR